MKRIWILGCLAAMASSALGAIQTKTVTYQSGGKTMEGYMAWDDAKKGKRPVVVVVHDWDGLGDYEKMRCRMLAELGYVGFAADVYGQGVRPTTPQECSAEAGKYYNDNALLRQRLSDAIKSARKQSVSDGKKSAAIGYCFGGMSVLEIARMGADVKGVVSFHGSLGTKNPSKPGGIKSEILVCHGGADGLVPQAQVDGFKAEMKAASADFDFITYDGAKHAFTVPGSDKMGNPNVGYDEKADKASWDAMKRFLAAVFG